MSAPSPIQCKSCQKTFSRLEHLQRHSATHTQSKPFACRYCVKAFSRKDTAQRHEQYSHAPSNAGNAGPVLRTMRRACFACGSARILCPGGNPCINCENKNIQCQYLRRKQNQASTYAITQSAKENDLAGASLAMGNAMDLDMPTQMESLEEFESSPDQDLDSQNTGSLSDYSRTAINWLPFALPDIGDLTSIQPQFQSPSTAPLSDTSNLDTFSLSLETVENESHGFSQVDSIATFIASMGRASETHGFSNAFLPVDGRSVDKTSVLYSDGAGARNSQADRSVIRRHSVRPPASASSSNEPTSRAPSGFSDSSWLEALEDSARAAPDQHMDEKYQIPEYVYSGILAKVDGRMPLASRASTRFLHSGSFPSKSLLQHFIRLYFEQFHPVYPFLDQPLLSMPDWGWSLCLATAAIGCCYANIPEAHLLSDALAVVLHQMLVMELDFGHEECTMPYLQALILKIVVMCHSGRRDLMAMGYEAVNPVMNACVRFGLFEEINGVDLRVDAPNLDQAWTAWRCRETRRRTGMFAWIVDCALAFTSASPPTLISQTLNLSLPSSEKLWEATSWQRWMQACEPTVSTMSTPAMFLDEEKSRPAFSIAIAKLYRQFELVNGISQFASTILIHALIQRGWDIIKYFDGPLYMPNDQDPSAMDSQITSAGYLATVPEFSKWRNRACDYLDVLHWDALGTSARAGGLEGPIFLQLHLARLLLLTPVKELLTSVELLLSTDSTLRLPNNLTWPRLSLASCQRNILTWARQDHYKARLAVIHAGATFWHVRRYASNSFTQPFVVFLAAIVLHYFGKLSLSKLPDTYEQGQFPNNNIEGGPTIPLQPATNAFAAPPVDHSRRGSHFRMPSFFHIDRPVDDELVQHFVRNGEASTRLCAEGVDDLCSSQGALGILTEAAAILRSFGHIWRVSESYALALEAVAASNAA